MLTGKDLLSLVKATQQMDDAARQELSNRCPSLYPLLARLSRLLAEAKLTGSLVPICRGCTTVEESWAAQYDHALHLDHLLNLSSGAVRELAATLERPFRETTQYPN